MAQKYIRVGRLGATYGVKGWQKVQSFTDDPTAIFEYSPWSIGPSASQVKPCKSFEWRRHSNSYIVKFADIDQREMAQQITGQFIWIERTNLPTPENGEHYWQDLIGCQVVTTDGVSLGKVTSLMETGSNDVLVVKASVGDDLTHKERLIPFVDEQFICQVCTTSKQITVNWDPAF